MLPRMSASDIALTHELIRKAMLRAEQAVCPPADQRCFGFPYDAKAALARRTPAGWCAIGWVAADSGRETWTAWFNVATGEGRLN